MVVFITFRDSYSTVSVDDLHRWCPGGFSYVFFKVEHRCYQIPSGHHLTVQLTGATTQHNDDCSNEEDVQWSTRFGRSRCMEPSFQRGGV